jgi:hypothetical protein
VPRPTTHRYTVTIRVVTHWEQTDRDGTDTSDVSWTGAWRNFPVKTLVFGKEMTVNTVAPGPPGLIEAKAKWSRTNPKIGGPCDGVVTDRPRARLLVLGLVAPPRVHSFHATLDPYPADTFSLRVLDQQKGQCKRLGFGTERWNLGHLSRRLDGPFALQVNPDEELLTLHLDGSTSDSNPYPVPLLAAGKPFRFRTNKATASQSCGAGCTVESTAQATVTFTKVG